MPDIARPTLIKGGRILDIDGDLDSPPQRDVLIHEGRIREVGAAANEAARRDDIEVIDATGKLLIPGLVNAHYHSHDTMLRGMFEQLPLDAWMLYSSPGQFPHFSSEMIETRTALGASECLLNGITTIQDMVSIVGDDQSHVDQVMQCYERLGIRAVLALQVSDRAACDCVAFWDSLPRRTAQCLPSSSNPDAQFEFLESALRKQSALVSWGLGPSAPQRCSSEFLARFARLSAERGLQVFTHTYESRSQAVLARLKFPQGSLIEHLDRAGLLGPRLTIAHGVWITGSEIARLGENGANLVCNPTSNLKLLNGFAPLLDYASANVNIGLGCDNCSGNDAQNLFESMKNFALMWGMYAGAGTTSAAREAFRAATVGSATAIGLGNEIGLLRPGYRADIVMIDLGQPNYRPLNSAVRQLVYGETGRAIEKVMIEGKIVVDSGKIISPLFQDLKVRAERAKDQLAEHVDALRARNGAILGDILAAYEKANRYPLEFDRFSLRRP
jgi:5-methylthioadenosine/S-adenosylhomocysteine deaminase